MKIIDWWLRNRRSYPWRKTSDPYKIAIAEIMLQRTRADQVLPIYLSFIKKFPTITDLAKASEVEISYFFRKLGLFWRAGLVKKMANFVVKEYRGTFPKDLKSLIKIPAIGEYISRAILSFAYGKRVVVIDSNICRIVKRIFGIEVSGEARRNRDIQRLAEKLLPSEIESKFINWALIDFSALICKPSRPSCEICPIRNCCNYFKMQDA